MKAETMRMYTIKAAVIAAAGHPFRLAIIDFLKDGEQCVCDIVTHIGAERSNISRHLSVLLKAGIVEQRRNGLRMIYSLRTPCVLNFMNCVSGVLREQVRDVAAALRES